MSCIKQAKASVPDTPLTYFFSDEYGLLYLGDKDHPSPYVVASWLYTKNPTNQQLAMNYDKNFEECCMKNSWVVTAALWS